MKNVMKKIPAILMMAMILFTLSAPVYAEETTTVAAQTAETEQITDTEDATGDKALGAAIAVGLAAAAGAVGMGIAIAKSSEGIARQPEAEGKIRTNLMLGLVFIETAIIYALIVAILIIFVL
ncbi:F-type H+-transporting ATPase subunit c [Marvinbryantia formatexigens]|nr:ATP synthase F0 subunit C [Marvinbryantia formatexigens]SDF67461.1 F-type H+-transporting ATPase subunit c [Marvinbryantia formatexigens]